MNKCQDCKFYHYNKFLDKKECTHFEASYYCYHIDEDNCPFKRINNIDKIKIILKRFEESSVKDLNFYAYEIDSIYTGFIPAKYFIIDENGKTLQDLLNESKTK